MDTAGTTLRGAAHELERRLVHATEAKAIERVDTLLDMMRALTDVEEELKRNERGC